MGRQTERLGRMTGSRLRGAGRGRVGAALLGTAGALAGLGLMAGPMAAPAAACGGLFCNNSQPVNQAAERIIFVDNGDDTITAAIEIQYQGPSEKFAWVLPLPGIEDPEQNIRVSSVTALDRLQQRTNPLYQLQTMFTGECPVPAMAPAVAGAVPATPAPPPTADSGVTVEASGSVGPFDYELISVDKDLSDAAMVAVMWLEDNGYDVSGIGADLLRPYLESENQLLAVRLQKGNDAGSIRPLMITYQGTKPSIPIRPTAVAANDDMGVMVWVGGSDRAVPINYHLLELNEARINWFNPTPGYNDLIIEAADEAGGHGFVTEYADRASTLADVIVMPWERQQWMELSNQPFATGLQLYNQARNQFGGWDGMQDAFRAALTLPAGATFTLQDVLNCPGCYLDETGLDPTRARLDVNVLRTQIYELVIRPMLETEALLQSANYVTRLYTTLSPEEMTMDPAFDFNPDMDAVDNVHIRTRVIEGCGGFGGPWSVDFGDGVVVRGEGQAWPAAMDDMPATVRILEATTSGEPSETRNNLATITAILNGDPIPDPPATTPPQPPRSMPDGTPAPTPPTPSGTPPVGPGSTPAPVAGGESAGDAGSDSGGGLFCSVNTPGQGGTAPTLGLGLLLGLSLMRLRRKR